MKATQKLHDAGQSLWLDNITRALLESGTLQRYIDELSVTGLTSNPTIFHNAISKGAEYDEEIRRLADAGQGGEEIFFALALADLVRAADLFRPVHERTDGADGWVSLEVSPLLAYDAERTKEAARDLHARAGRPNLFIKIPGTREGLPAIEESIYAGVPVNVTLLFSREQYLAAADAYLRGIERRLAAGLDPAVRSVASVFISRWDKATMERAPAGRRSRLGIAVAERTYQAYRELLASDRWQRLAAAGAKPQILLWASTSTKDPQAKDILYINALAAPETINTMPEETLLAFADHGEVGGLMPVDGGNSAEVIAAFEEAGFSYETLAANLQREGADAFVKSWKDLLALIDEKSGALQGTATSAGETK